MAQRDYPSTDLLLMTGKPLWRHLQGSDDDNWLSHTRNQPNL